MNQRELDQIATLVVQKLHASGTSRAGNVPRRTETFSPPSNPVGGTPRAQVDAPVAPKTAAAPRSRRVADFVDHTLLKAEATREEIEKLCAEARQYEFAAVCVNGCWVKTCADLLSGTGVKVATVVGFPLGAMTSVAKAFEAGELVKLGADELDMVAPIGHIHDQDWDYVQDDIEAVVSAAQGRTVKVILETGTLEPLVVVKASAIAMEAGAGYVKTSTGFHPSGGATPEAVALMRLAVGDRLGVKAAGGVRDCAGALNMIAAGASRIGTSNGVNFVECIGAGPAPLEQLLSNPDAHDHVCKTGTCGGVY